MSRRSKKSMTLVDEYRGFCDDKQQFVQLACFKDEHVELSPTGPQQQQVYVVQPPRSTKRRSTVLPGTYRTPHPTSGDSVYVGLCPLCKRHHYATRHLSQIGDSDHDCNDSCKRARGPVCVCHCEGENHGTEFPKPRRAKRIGDAAFSMTPLNGSPLTPPSGLKLIAILDMPEASLTGKADTSHIADGTRVSEHS